MAPSSQQFRQAVAVVCHGERLDRTQSWAAFAASPSHRAWRHDPPLSVAGKKRSRITGQRLGLLTPEGASPYELIIASPELRCAQTASEIAQELGLPVLFDGDFVDVFSDLCGDCGRAHRSPQELVKALQDDYPDVQYAVDHNGQMKIVCGVEPVDESISDVASRHCHKVQFVVEASTLQRQSVIIVCHPSAVAPVAHNMKQSLRLTDVPLNGFFIAMRTVKFEIGEFAHPVAQFGSKASIWNIILSAGIKCVVQGFRTRLSSSVSSCRLSHPAEEPREYHALHRNIFGKDASQFRRCRSINSLEFLLDGEESVEPPIGYTSGLQTNTRTKSSVEMLDRFLGTSFFDSVRSNSLCVGHDIFQEVIVC